MGLLAIVVLRVLHFIYGFSLFVYSFLKRSHSSKSLKRARVPKHLALILVASVDPESEECLFQCVIDAVGWCRSAGIEKLTVYDEHGQLQNCSQQIRNFFARQSAEESSDSEIEFPLTPPSSDSSLSRPISPEDCLHLDTNTVAIHIPDHPIERKRKNNDVKRRRRVQRTAHDHGKPFTLCLASRKSSKPVLALAAQSFVLKRKSKLPNHAGRSEAMSFTLSMDDLDRVLEVDDGLSSPDFMIVHPTYPFDYNQTPLELHGYPPWHIRLTEIYHNRFYESQALPLWLDLHGSSCKPLVLEECTFQRALDEFATAEMRFGK